MPRPVLLELVGLPGAGKSTLWEALRRHDERVAGPPSLRRWPYALGLARHTVGTTAALVARRAIDRRWTRDQLMMMVHLRALPPVLEQLPAQPRTLVAFDQGALFTLTRTAVREDRLGGWFDTTLARWTALLDAVVWLEAPDAVLGERIQTRGKAHRLRGAPEERVRGKLAADRATYERLLARIAEAPGAPLVLRFDTARSSADAIAAEVLHRVLGP